MFIYLFDWVWYFVPFNMSVKWRMILVNACGTTRNIMLNMPKNQWLLILAATKMVSLWLLTNASSHNLSYGFFCFKREVLDRHFEKKISLAASISLHDNCVREVLSGCLLFTPLWRFQPFLFFRNTIVCTYCFLLFCCFLYLGTLLPLRRGSIYPKALTCRLAISCSIIFILS